MPKTSSELKKLLEKQHYAFIGDHSAIKVCEWTKQSLRGKGVCYKEKFYNIKSHRCCQISTTIGYCQNACLFCWRPIEHTEGIKMSLPLDSPKELIENAIKAQQNQLSGFKGSKTTDKKKFKEAQIPNQFAISLSGEPLLYPKLGELIQEINKRDSTSFVVTNGLLPNKLKSLSPLPTNLYISLDAPNETLFKKIDRPKIKNAWKKLNQSLEILKDLKTTTVLRLTMIINMNMVHPEQYAKLIEKAQPDFVEVKAYMWVGYSQNRLNIKNMPRHPEIKAFSKEILKHLKNYRFKDEKKESRVVLFARN